MQQTTTRRTETTAAQSVNQSNVRSDGDSSKAVGGYGVRRRDTNHVFFDAQLPYDDRPESREPEPIRAQTERCLERLAGRAHSAGLDQDDLLQATVYYTDGKYGEIRTVLEAFFGAKRPALTFVGCESLPLGANVQIEAIGVDR